MTTDRKVLDLPAPHIHPDGTVSTLRVVRYANRDWFGLRDDTGYSVIVHDANHARALARALTIAADLLDANPEE